MQEDLISEGGRSAQKGRAPQDGFAGMPKICYNKEAGIELTCFFHWEEKVTRRNPGRRDQKMWGMDLLILLIFMIPTLDMEVRRKGSLDSYLEPRQTGQLKGLFALFVIVHHLVHRTEDGIGFPYFGNIGYLAVSFFFFISGYGLMVQYMKKEEGYLETFLSNRLPKVAAPFAVGLVIYYAANRILNSDFSLGTALQSFVTGKIYVSFSWYVIAIILFYLVFYAAARISKDQYKHLAFMIAVGLLVYSLLCHGLGFQKHWYKTCTNFLLGVVWGIYSEPISKWLDKKWLPTICFSLLGFVFFYVQVVQNKAQSMGYFLLIHYLSSAFFCITVAALGKKVQLNSRLLTYLGDISYEVYLSQGLAILFFRNDLWYQRSDYLFSVGVFLGSVLIAVLFHKINMFLLEPKKHHRYAVSFVELLKDKQ